MSRAAPRRRAEKPRRARRGRDEPVTARPPATVVPPRPEPPLPAPPASPSTTAGPEGPAPRAATEGAPPSADRWATWRRRGRALADSRVPLLTWCAVVLAGAALLVAAVVPVGPAWLGGVGSVAVVSAYSWALAARTGGRPLVFGGLALATGVVVLLLEDDRASTGAAVMTCAISAVLAVMVTVPARRFRGAVRECVVAVAVASLGALATVGFEPALAILRFQYATLGLGLVGAFLLVHRLGAGFHGLGRRGLVATALGVAVLLVFVGYAELLRAYGPGDAVGTVLDGVRWSRETLGAFPRPLETALGVPALAWGCHMRARRRQGWWVCAFGAAGTVSVANALVDPSVALLESGLSVVYGLVLGLLLGYAVIRVDLALTGPRGRRARRDEQAAAERPEPRRTQPLL